ncbi:MAG TPA: hypothetical protein VK665_14060 [Candidatus Elarobacter sp.]|nr:hypothetical protein [Candidatus Elarobacter sp.]
MAAVIEPAERIAAEAHDPALAVALYSLGLPANAEPAGFVPLPSRVVEGIVAVSALITGAVWMIRLTGRG